MEHKYDDHYRNLDKMVTGFHEKKKKRLKVSGIILLILPVVLGFMRWITDSDKVVFLLIWVLCMFAVSSYLVSVEYMDELIRNKYDPDAAPDAEEGDER